MCLFWISVFVQLRKQMSHNTQPAMNDYAKQDEHDAPMGCNAMLTRSFNNRKLYSKLKWLLNSICCWAIGFQKQQSIMEVALRFFHWMQTGIFSYWSSMPEWYETELSCCLAIGCKQRNSVSKAPYHTQSIYTKYPTNWYTSAPTIKLTDQSVHQHAQLTGTPNGGQPTIWCQTTIQSDRQCPTDQTLWWRPTDNQPNRLRCPTTGSPTNRHWPVHQDIRMTGTPKCRTDRYTKLYDRPVHQNVQLTGTPKCMTDRYTKRYDWPVHQNGRLTGTPKCLTDRYSKCKLADNL
jgi:hypothetical protein